MFGNLDPKKMAQVQKISSQIDGEVKVDYRTKTITIKLDTQDQQAMVIVQQLLSQFSVAIATQLNSFFAIKGRFVEVGKDQNAAGK